MTGKTSGKQYAPVIRGLKLLVACFFIPTVFFRATGRLSVLQSDKGHATGKIGAKTDAAIFWPLRLYHLP